MEVTLEDQTWIYCKGEDGKFSGIKGDGGTRLSEFGCLYGVEEVSTRGIIHGRVCEARRANE